MRLPLLKHPCFAVADIAVTLVDCLLNRRRIHQHPAFFVQVAGQRIKGRVVKGKQKMPTGSENPLADLLHDCLPLGTREFQFIATLFQPLRKGLKKRAVKNHLFRRDQRQPLNHLRAGTLADRVEMMHLFDEIPVKIESYRLLGVGRE